MAGEDKKKKDEPTVEELFAAYLSTVGGGAGASSDPKITVPAWIKAVSVIDDDFNQQLAPGEMKYSKLILLPMQWYTSTDKADQAKYRKLSNYLFGNTNGTVTDVDTAWRNILGIAKDYDITLENLKKTPGVMSLIKKGTTFAGPSDPNYNYSLSTQDTADSVLTQKMSQWLGRQPTKAEKSSFYKQLIKEQKKVPTISTTAGNNTYTTAGGITADEFATKFVLNKIAVDNPDLKGNLGKVQDTFVAAAKRNGFDLTGADVIGLVKRAAAGEDVSVLASNFTKRAQNKYTGLADAWAINPDATVYDLSSEYINEMARTLELDPNQITIKDIEPAIAAIGTDGKQRALSPWEWRKQLRADSRYQYTNQARQEATGMAQSFARAFGVNV
jgi:hypothetical protein